MHGVVELTFAKPRSRRLCQRAVEEFAKKEEALKSPVLFSYLLWKARIGSLKPIEYIRIEMIECWYWQHNLGLHVPLVYERARTQILELHDESGSISPLKKSVSTPGLQPYRPIFIDIFIRIYASIHLPLVGKNTKEDSLCFSACFLRRNNVEFPEKWDRLLITLVCTVIRYIPRESDSIRMHSYF
jgi:hypothetical protein